jgi:single-stranded-DNA-specific exonuclease
MPVPDPSAILEGASQAAAFLGVERSVRGRSWRLSAADADLVSLLIRRFGLPEVVARAMAVRGISAEAAESYLNPTLRALMPDPSRLVDLDRAVERLVAAVRAGEAITVFGDYDVDGATSAALLVRYFRALGMAAQVYIPDRIAEGYGPNAAALLGLREAGTRLLLTVDCGVTAIDALAAAHAAGMEVIVVDHHQVEENLPQALAVVDPKRGDDTSGTQGLAAVGVTFLLLAGLNRALRRAGWFDAARPEPDLMGLLDLVAFGTVCDVVPLVGINRAFVSQGLKVLAAGGNAGFAALAASAGIKPPFETYHIGFVMGPRVNAGGRVGKSDLGARLLACDDPELAGALAEELEHHNAARREIEAAALDEAVEQVAATLPPDSPVVVAAGEDWHPGVVGLVAARLKERFNVPACAVTFLGENGKGSGRSVPGVNLGAAILAAREAGVLLTGGGHAMAAGFTLERRDLSRFCAFLSDHVRSQAGAAETMPLPVDGAIDVRGATSDLVSVLSRMEPFGTGNEEPRFAVPSVRLGRASVVGAGHVRAYAYGKNGGRLKIIAFRVADEELGQALLGHRDRLVHLMGVLRADTWQGRRDVQLVVEDMAWADQSEG